MPVFRGKITLETSTSFHVFVLAYVLHIDAKTMFHQKLYLEETNS